MFMCGIHIDEVPQLVFSSQTLHLIMSGFFMGFTERDTNIPYMTTVNQNV